MKGLEDLTDDQLRCLKLVTAKLISESWQQVQWLRMAGCSAKTERRELSRYNDSFSEIARVDAVRGGFA